MKLIFFLGIVCVLGCGVKGAPLPPIVIHPEHSDQPPKH
jgi:hypothetical protein